MQRRNGLEIKDVLIPIGDAVLQRIRAYAAGSPFLITSVVVGNVQYPDEVANAVSRKLAATQELQRKDTEIEIERKEKTKREVQAEGIANAMQIIRGQLSPMYIQHEAIEAQKADGGIAESHGGVHPRGIDGRAADRNVPGSGTQGQPCEVGHDLRGSRSYGADAARLRTHEREVRVNEQERTALRRSLPPSLVAA